MMTSMTEAPPAPWERQPGESARAYGAFCLYRDAGPRRSLRETCRRYYGNTTSVRRLSIWSSRWRWPERCRAWDDHLDGLARQEQARQRKEMVELHARAARALVDRAAEAAALVAPSDLKPADVIKWLVEAAKLERLSRGEPETIQEQRGEAHVTIDVFQQVEQYAAVLQARREQGGLLAGPVRGDGAPEPLDEAPPDAEAG
jgi:hypothetical protein